MTHSQPPTNLPLRVGAVLYLRDDDYRYGRGPLTVRVMALHDVRHYPDGLWLFLRGMALATDGREVEQRDVLVRVTALGRAGRRSG